MRGLDGAPQLIELELIEPDLYLGYDAGAGARFAAAVAAALLARRDARPAGTRAGYGAVITVRATQ